MNPQNSVDDFFSKLPDEQKEEADIFDETLVAEKPKQIEDDPEQVPESIKNRQHRRLQQKLQAEREANIALTERLKTLSEMDKFAKENPDDVDPRIAKMFPSDEYGKLNAKELTRVLKENAETAEQRAIEKLRKEREEELKATKEYEDTIDSQLENLEEKYGVDLTSESPRAEKLRTEFLSLVGKLSPKGKDGKIQEYADFDSTFEIFQKSHSEPRNTRKQEIASRSMQRSGQSSGTTQQRTPGFDGWKKDLERGII